MNCTLLKTLIATTMVCGAAQAQAVTLDFLGFANGSQSVNYALSAPNTPVSGFTQAGGFSAVLNGGPTFTTYCIDLYESIRFSDAAYTNYNLVDGSLHAFANSRADQDIGKLFSAGHVVNNATTQAAFQIAVWELAYETSSLYDLGSGAARFFGGTAASSGALTLASSWLASLGSVTNTVDVQTLESIDTLRVAGHQDQVFAAPIPEPSTYALLAGGLMAVGFMARRRAPRA